MKENEKTLSDIQCLFNIYKIKDLLGISVADMSLLLGMGEHTLMKYKNGSASPSNSNFTLMLMVNMNFKVDPKECVINLFKVNMTRLSYTAFIQCRNYIKEINNEYKQTL